MNTESGPTTVVAPFGDPIAPSVTFVDFVASTDHTPRPASMTLDVARHHAFTGEIRFATDPTVSVFVDGGVVYHAERGGDVPLSRLVLDAGVLDAHQLERGVIRVGDVEHLGRIFDRDDTIERDAVMVLVENRTDEIVNQLADHEVATATARAYRHHPSGIHRWFVAPSSRSPRAMGKVGSIDWSVVDGPTGSIVLDEARANEARTNTVEVDSTPDGTTADDIIVSPTHVDVRAELDHFDADHGTAAFQMSPVVVHELPTSNATVPTDVAEAVRRALPAMSRVVESQSWLSASVLAPDPLDDAEPSAPLIAPRPANDATPAPITDPQAAPFVFAPPTPDMRAEVMYEHADDISATYKSDPASAPIDEPGERRSALRRLIGSLRSR